MDLSITYVEYVWSYGPVHPHLHLLPVCQRMLGPLFCRTSLSNLCMLVGPHLLACWTDATTLEIGGPKAGPFWPASSSSPPPSGAEDPRARTPAGSARLSLAAVARCSGPCLAGSSAAACRPVLSRLLGEEAATCEAHERVEQAGRAVYLKKKSTYS